jgi:hypothetical protein
VRREAIRGFIRVIEMEITAMVFPQSRRSKPSRDVTTIN